MRRERGRERERERERARERKPDHAFDIAGEAQIVVFGSDDRTLQSDDREEAQIIRSSSTIARSSPTIYLAFDLAPLDLAARSHLRAISASTHRSLSMILIFVVVVWWCGSGVLVVMAFDCWNLLPWVELEFRWCVVLAVILKFFLIKFVWMLRK